MEKFSCIIVEDEPLAAEILEDYIKQIPFLEIKGICSDALYALETVQRLKPDVIFLDIHLPKLNGLDFLKTLKNPPQVIITTAYRDYALDGYELNVVDYLLKPVNFNRFIAAVNKLKGEKKYNASHRGNDVNTIEKSHLFININKKKVKVYHDEILYIESKKEYINIVTSDKAYLTKFQLSDIETQLDKRSFMRIHRSFIVSVEKIKAFNSSELEINGQTIPIGRSYKELVMNILEKNT